MDNTAVALGSTEALSDPEVSTKYPRIQRNTFIVPLAELCQEHLQTHLQGQTLNSIKDELGAVFNQEFMLRFLEVLFGDNGVLYGRPEGQEVLKWCMRRAKVKPDLFKSTLLHSTSQDEGISVTKLAAKWTIPSKRRKNDPSATTTGKLSTTTFVCSLARHCVKKAIKSNANGKSLITARDMAGRIQKVFNGAFLKDFINKIFGPRGALGATCEREAVLLWCLRSAAALNLHETAAVEVLRGFEASKQKEFSEPRGTASDLPEGLASSNLPHGNSSVIHYKQIYTERLAKQLATLCHDSLSEESGVDQATLQAEFAEGLDVQFFAGLLDAIMLPNGLLKDVEARVKILQWCLRNIGFNEEDLKVPANDSQHGSTPSQPLFQSHRYTPASMLLDGFGPSYSTSTRPISVGFESHVLSLGKTAWQGCATPAMLEMPPPGSPAGAYVKALTDAASSAAEATSQPYKPSQGVGGDFKSLKKIRKVVSSFDGGGSIQFSQDTTAPTPDKDVGFGVHVLHNAKQPNDVFRSQRVKRDKRSGSVALEMDIDLDENRLRPNGKVEKAFAERDLSTRPGVPLQLYGRLPLSPTNVLPASTTKDFRHMLTQAVQTPSVKFGDACALGRDSSALEIHKCVDHRYNAGKRRYQMKVRWWGFKETDDSWIDVYDLLEEAPAELQQYIQAADHTDPVVRAIKASLDSF